MLASVWQTKRHEFHSEAELRVALEDYTEYNMAEGRPGADGDGDPDKRDKMGRIYAQNLEIDRGMVYIGAASPYGWRFLDRYFRKGLHLERRGWIETWRMCGLPVPDCYGFGRCQVLGDHRHERELCRRGEHCEELRDEFEEHLTVAIEALLGACDFRRKRMNMED